MTLSLITKTRLIFAFLLLCFVALGALSINRLTAVSGPSAEISQVWVPRAQAAAELSSSAQEYRISEALRILSVSPEMAAQADEDLNQNAARFTKQLAAYRRGLHPGENTAAIDNIGALWDGYISGNQQMLQFAAGQQSAEAVDRFRNSASKFYLVSNALRELSAYDAEQSALASKHAQKTNQQARYIVLGFLLFVTALLCVVGIYIRNQVWHGLIQQSVTMQRLATGDLTITVEGLERRDEVGDMARAIQVCKDIGLEMQRLEVEAEAQKLVSDEAQRIQDALAATTAANRDFVVSSVASGLAELSAGDLTVRLTEPFAEEFEKLRADFNLAVENLQDTMKVIAFGAVGIQSSTKEISQASDDLARRTEKQAASLEEVAAALEQVTTTVRSTAEGAQHAKSAVAAAKANTERSGEVVRNAVAAMSEIERSARQISEIIGVMDEIAFQTNLLALNAGVEAARAGEAGRGFAVVAQEVRALAQRSTVAAKEIKALISSSSQQVGAGVSLVGETGTALVAIAAQVGEINAAVADIAVAAEDQATGLLQINMSVSQMDKVTQQNAAMAEESTAASHTLAQETNDLARLIGRFNLGHGATPVAAPAAPTAHPRGRAILRTMSRGSSALSAKLEDAIADEGWEEF